MLACAKRLQKLLLPLLLLLLVLPLLVVVVVVVVVVMRWLSRVTAKACLARNCHHLK